MQPDYERNIFLNCPFDGDYAEVFQSIVFGIFDCGYNARCALEISDSSEVRIEKIAKIIKECQLGIHDISRTELDKKSGLPRFNMPLELGIFLGAKRFGANLQKKKICLVLDKEPYRYQSFISDIAGQDIQAHNNNADQVIKIVRNWLKSLSKEDSIPGGKEILRRFKLFKTELPALCEKLKLAIDEMIFNDYINIVSIWIKENPSILT